MKNKITDLIIQIISVMIGVYLGFVVSNWSESQKMIKKSESFLNNIVIEIKSNKKRLEGIIDYHVMLKDSSRYYLSGDETTSIEESTAFFKGLQTSTLVESAYKTGVQTGIVSELELNIIQNLNQLYTYQDEYNEYHKISLEAMINMDFSRNKESIQRILQLISLSMADITIKEQQLIKEYDAILKQIDTKNK